MDTRYLLPISNVYERIFSIAGHALTNCHRELPLSNFESQLFLYINFKYWGVEEAKRIVHDEKTTVFGST